MLDDTAGELIRPLSALSPTDDAPRLAMLGRLARRISEQPEAPDLARFTYQALREVLSVDMLHLLQTGLELSRQALIASSGAAARSAPPAARPAAEWRVGDAQRIRSQLAYTLKVGDRVVGRLVLGTKRQAAYSLADMHFVQTVANQLAIALAADLDRMVAQLREEEVQALEQERAKIAQILGAISTRIDEDSEPARVYALVLQQAALVVPYQDASITLYLDGVHQVVAVVGTTLQGIPESVTMHSLWRTHRNLDMEACLREPALSRFARAAGIRDLLSLPLLLNGMVIGRLTFASPLPRRYNARHLQLAQLLAERTSQVVRMAHLQAVQEATLAKMMQLETLRTEFVATVSHELRTPLTGILGYLELLLSRWSSLNDERRRSMLQRAQSSAARLEHLVTDLLLFSNVEHQELQLHIASCPLEMLVEQAVEDMRTKYRDQQILVRPSRQSAVVQADVQRAIQVIANLLDNAVKYSAEGTPVGVRWVVRPTEVEVVVRDCGPGIKAADRPRLFTRFGTLGHQPRPGQVGTGIGLYVCKRLLEGMRGHIWVVSRSGRGSFFHFTLPRADAAAVIETSSSAS